MIGDFLWQKYKHKNTRTQKLKKYKNNKWQKQKWPWAWSSGWMAFILFTFSHISHMTYASMCLWSNHPFAWEDALALTKAIYPQVKIWCKLFYVENTNVKTNSIKNQHWWSWLSREEESPRAIVWPKNWITLKLFQCYMQICKTYIYPGSLQDTFETFQNPAKRVSYCASKRSWPCLH